MRKSQYEDYMTFDEWWQSPAARKPIPNMAPKDWAQLAWEAGREEKRMYKCSRCYSMVEPERMMDHAEFHLGLTVPQ